MSDAQDNLWESYKRGVRRSPGVQRVLPSDHSDVKRTQKSKKGPSFRLKRNAASLPEFDARIDLHGLTQTQAYEKLKAFVAHQSGLGAKRLLIVTGKGREGTSVLRANAPRWCAEKPFSAFVAAIEPAAIEHGGEGAFYAVMKRKS